MGVLEVSGLGLWATVAVFAGAALVVAVCGTFLTRAADQLADITGLGEALIGAVFLGAVTSLAGVVTTLAAAAQGHPQLAVSNAIGGIALQTAFLGIADVVYRKANLEHAAASLANLMYSVLLIGLLVALLVIVFAPAVTFWGVHPASPVLVLVYLAGLKMVSKAGEEPMWMPRSTAETVEDEPQEEHRQRSLSSVLTVLLVNGVLVAVAGYLVAQTGIALAEQTGLSESFVGSLFTALATSLPELVVSISAVRQGALTLAVGNIVGGNSFEVLVVAAADGVYLEGSILHAVTRAQVFLIALTALLMAILLMGLIYRQRVGIGRMGWESFLILLLSVGGYWIMYRMG